MKADRPSEATLRKVFCEIAQGYTPVTVGEKDAVIRHLKQRDQYDLECHREEIYNKAKASGLPTEEEALEVLIEGEVWSHKEENEIGDMKKYVENLEDTKKNLIIPSQIENINKDIEEGRQKLNDLSAKRKSLLAETCESYAAKKNNDYSIYLCLYQPQDHNLRFFTWDEFCEMPKVTLGELFTEYVKATQHLNPENIKYLSISSVFALYYNILGGKNLHKLFDCPAYELSFYQLNLLNFAKILHSILENVEGIPSEIKKEPDDLLAYAESKRKNKNIVEKSKGKQGFSVMGATKKDMDEMGVSDELAVSPFELAKNKGSLTLEDFQDFS